MSVEIFDCDSGSSLGAITDEQLQALVDALEEESLADKDYHITQDTIAMLEEDGAPAGLIALLRAGIGAREEFDIRWEKR